MNRIDRLTSVRGFAALYVVLFHCQGVVAGFNLTPWTNLVEKGYLGVDFFFILSGFIIAYVYAPAFDAGRGDYRRFLLFRLARVYPVHLVTLAIVFAIWGFGDTFLFTNTPRTLAANTLMVHAWGISRKLSFNYPSWSISAEWFAYLAFPLLLALSKPVVRRPALAITAAISCIVVLGLCVSALLNTPPERPFDMAARFALVKVTFEFLAGLLLFRAYSALHGRELRWVTGSTIAVAVMLLVALHSKALPPVVQDPLAVLMAAMLILCLALGGGAGGLLESRAAVFLGEASYSIYMVHGLVMLEYFQLIERHAVATEASLAAGLLRVALVVAIVIVLGVVLYRFVEVPSRRAVRALAG